MADSSAPRKAGPHVSPILRSPQPYCLTGRRTTHSWKLLLSRLVTGQEMTDSPSSPPGYCQPCSWLEHPLPYSRVQPSCNWLNQGRRDKLAEISKSVGDGQSQDRPQGLPIPCQQIHRLHSIPHDLLGPALQHVLIVTIFPATWLGGAWHDPVH